MEKRNLTLSIIIGVLLSSCVLVVSSGVAAAHANIYAVRAATPTKRVKLAISDMYCKACEPSISGELMRTPGVIAATVSYERQEAIVDYDSSKITTAGIIAAIKGAGFTAKVKRT